jgi:hypothetical protein
MSPIKFTVVAEDAGTRTVTLRWPTGETISAHYPSSALGPTELGWTGTGTCWAWCLVEGRVPWIFAFDLT